jgi:hypothetical protein
MVWVVSQSQREWVVSRSVFFKKLISNARRAPVHFFLRLFAILLFSGSLIRASQADEIRFAPFVSFKTFGVGEVGTLKTKAGANDIEMTLSNVAIGGADKTQELQTLVDRKDLSLIQSNVYDPVKGKHIRTMQRKTGQSTFGTGKAELFEYKEMVGNNTTVTEPYVQFKVADFVSIMLIAADAINRDAKQPVDISMLRDRSVTRVVMTIAGQESVGDRQGTIVKVAPPDNPSGGITYVLARTGNGAFYPAKISAETPRGAVVLEGSPQ